jgi:hypothetical protein
MGADERRGTDERTSHAFLQTRWHRPAMGYATGMSLSPVVMFPSTQFAETYNSDTTREMTYSGTHFNLPSSWRPKSSTRIHNFGALSLIFTN